MSDQNINRRISFIFTSKCTNGDELVNKLLKESKNKKKKKKTL